MRKHKRVVHYITMPCNTNSNFYFLEKTDNYEEVSCRRCLEHLGLKERKRRDIKKYNKEHR
jgi:hypothetical protein